MFSTDLYLNICVQSANSDAFEVVRGMAEQLLDAFYRERGCWPDKIVFLRNGVSERQFRQVRVLHFNSLLSNLRTEQQQKQPDEVIEWFVDAFYHRRSCWPNKIVFLRDGISERQLGQVHILNRFLSHISATTEVSSGYACDRHTTK